LAATEPCQAQQSVCQEYHRFVLHHTTEFDWSQVEFTENVAQDDDVQDSFNHEIEMDNNAETLWESVMKQLGISAFRPYQKESLDIIEQALNKSHQEWVTAGVVVPTSTGKDLLPFALSKYTQGVSIMFVPYK
jgi:hypothetical protein